MNDEICSDSEISTLKGVLSIYKILNDPIFNKMLAEEIEKFKQDNYTSPGRDNSNDEST